MKYLAWTDTGTDHVLGVERMDYGPNSTLFMFAHTLGDEYSHLNRGVLFAHILPLNETQ